MKNFRFSSLLLIMLCVSELLIAQKMPKPKRIRVKGDYTHLATGTVFPEYFGEYECNEVTKFDKEEQNVSAAYKFFTPAGPTDMTIYIYPAGKASDHRFRDEHYYCTQALAMKYGHNLSVYQHLCSYSKDGYKVNGCKVFFAEDGKSEVLEFYECGEWFFKIRVTSALLDSTQIYMLTHKIVEQIDPTNLVKHSSLSLKTSIGVSTDALVDSGLLYCVTLNALRKCFWVQNNVDSMEQIAGFPDLYLEEHLDILRNVISHDDTVQGIPKTKYFKKYVDELRQIDKAGYLDELIVHYYGDILIVPQNHIFDFKGYNLWRKEHKISVDIGARYATVSFMTREEAAKDSKE